MYARIFVLLYICFCPSFLTAQVVVKGILTDQNKAVLPFVNIVLQEANSTQAFVQGTMSDENGAFELRVKKGDYVLSISHVSYKTTTLNLACHEDKDLGKITLQSEAVMLDGVNVSDSRATVVKKIDRIQFKVENTLLAEGNMMEVLKNTPGLMINGNELQIYGKAGVMVLIDDRPVRLTGEDLVDMLTSLSAGDIEMVEVITNPSAEYDAEGNGLLNIVMKKRKAPGYKLTLRNRFERSVFSRYQHGFSADYSNKGLSVYGTYSFAHGKRNLREFTNIDFNNEENQVFSFWEEQLNKDSEYETHNLNAGIDWKIAPKSKFSLNVDGVDTATPDIAERSSTNVLGIDRQTDSTFTNNNIGNKGNDNWSYTLRFDQRLRNGKDRLRLEGNLIDYQKLDNQTVNTDFFDVFGSLNNRQAFNTSSNQDISIFYVKADYNMYLDSTSSLAFGLKRTQIESESDIEFFNLVEGQQLLDVSRTNTFKYEEQINAAYFSYSKSWKNLEFKGGLRFEETDTEGFSQTLNQTNVNDFLQWFPSASLQYNLANNNTLGLSYGRRVRRPRFTLLNPFQSFSSPFSFVEGNPFLRPAITDNIELSFDLKKQYFFTLFYTQNNRRFTQISLQDNESQIFRFIAINLDKTHTTGVSAYATYDILDWWSTIASGFAFYREADFINPETQTAVINTAITYRLNLINTFTVSEAKNLSMELSGWYYSGRIQGGFDLRSVAEVSVGIKKKLFNESATLSLNFTDVFDHNKVRIDSRYQNQNHTYRQNPENQQFRASFVYYVGNQSIGKRRKQRSEEQRRL